MSKPKVFKWSKKTKKGTYDKRSTTSDIFITWGITKIFSLTFKLILFPFIIVYKILSFPLKLFKKKY
jgi:hypothetical protein|tara:strand:- start:135 stop:335 length:201 start_codon:yes stop_codon:yes gene_type:complete